jgi:hypothetical protein
MDQKLFHLQIIQGIINRTSTNSFLLKGWSVTLVAALFALSAKDSNPVFVLMPIFPAVVFWLLDGFFLRIERQYQCLYDEVRLKAPDDIDFSLGRKHIKSFRTTWFASTFSSTLIIFYGGILATIVIANSFLK